MNRTLVWMAVLLVCLPAVARAAQVDPARYQEVTQADLVKSPDEYDGKKVCFTGAFLRTGGDFCYRFRRTQINTREYFCFALGTPSVVRLYLKRDHEQASRLSGLKKGARVTAYGTFDHVGVDYNFLLVDGITVEEEP